MAQYPYLGSTERFYSQYLNLADSTPLTALPGGIYQMTPVAGWEPGHDGNGGLPVPPGDGLWGSDTGTESVVAAEPAPKGKKGDGN